MAILPAQDFAVATVLQLGCFPNMNPSVTKLLSIEKSWGQLLPNFPAVRQLDWNGWRVEVSVWFWISGWQHPVQVRGSTSGVAVCFCLDAADSLPLVPGATAAYVTFRDAASAVAIREILETTETLWLQWQGGPLPHPELFQRLLAKGNATELSALLQSGLADAQLVISDESYEVPQWGSSLGPIIDLTHHLEKFYPRYWRSSPGIAGSSDARLLVLSCLGHEERRSTKSLVHALTLPPYGWSAADAREQVKTCVENGDLSIQGDEIFAGEYGMSWKQQSILAKVKRLKRHAMDYEHAPLEQLDFIESVFASPASLATSSAVAGMAWVNAALAIGVFSTSGQTTASLELPAKLKHFLNEANDLLAGANGRVGDYGRCIDACKDLDRRLRDAIPKLSLPSLDTLAVVPAAKARRSRMSAGNAHRHDLFARLPKSFLKVLEYDDHEPAQVLNKLYRDYHILIWGGRPFDGLTNKMMALLNFLIQNFSNRRNAWLSAAEIKKVPLEGFDFNDGILKAFELTRKESRDSTSGDDQRPRHEAYKIIQTQGKHRNMRYRLFSPREVERIFAREEALSVDSHKSDNL